MKVDLVDPAVAVQQLYLAHLALARGHYHTGRVDLDEAGDFLIALHEFAAGQPNGQHMEAWADRALAELHGKQQKIALDGVLYWSPDVDLVLQPELLSDAMAEDGAARRDMLPLHDFCTYVSGYKISRYWRAVCIFTGDLAAGDRRNYAVQPVPRNKYELDVLAELLETVLKDVSIFTMHDAMQMYFKPYRDDVLTQAAIRRLRGRLPSPSYGPLNRETFLRVMDEEDAKVGPKRPKRPAKKGRRAR